MDTLNNLHCDVLVVGAGIAGIMAALEAAQQGCTVMLASAGKIFSGSSFYPGTWGLGLIGPANAADQPDLVESILRIGCGMADPALVQAFVPAIAPAIQRVREMGIHLRTAQNSTQKDFIPCFDHKHRDWNGIEFTSAREVLSAKLNQLGVQQLPDCQLLHLHREAGRVCGAVVLHSNTQKTIGCGALVLATGGFGGLFKYHLNTGDVSAAGQFLAMEAGAELINMEFMQMMPGYVSPCYKTVFNEKTFRYTVLPSSIPQDSQLLELRSTHGPFTTRLASRAVDEALFAAFLDDPEGVPLRYCDALQQEQPEFIKTYFDWLREQKGLTPADPIRIGIFAHASNGGIRIAPDTTTGVQGLFACGEVTGGMHGADRIGGLSTANGLVFGSKAGAAAAQWASEHQPGMPEPLPMVATQNPEALRNQLREMMFRCAMVHRTTTGLEEGLYVLDILGDQCRVAPTQSPVAMANTRQLQSQLGTARAVLLAALLRRESRGSHCRPDYPVSDSRYARPIVVRQQAGVPMAQYLQEE